MDNVFGPGDLTAGVGYTLEDVGMSLNSGWFGFQPGLPGGVGGGPGPGGGIPSSPTPANVPDPILEQVGSHLFNRIDTTLAYDTRNSVKLPSHGQRTELDPQISFGGNTTYYKIEAKTAWFFPGFFKGHVWEADGRITERRTA